MGSQVLDASTLRGRFYHVPDCLRCDAIAPDLAQPTYSPEDRPTVDASRHDPLIDGVFRPRGNRNGTNVLPLPIKSAITQCSSRTWKSSVPSPTNSARRSPHPMSSATIARSRLPRRLEDGDSRSRVLD